MWDLYKAQPSFVLGFHGCDRKVGERVLSGDVQHLKRSENKYDWLGSGIYFWEGNPARALQFAQEAMERRHLTRGKVEEPFVVGAIIDLGLCCNLFDTAALDELGEAHEIVELIGSLDGDKTMPVNKGEGRGQRFLDRAVIEMMHKARQVARLPSYDTVRAGFPEGGELYDGAGFSKKSHIQIAVRNEACIKGYFRPIKKPSRRSA